MKRTVWILVFLALLPIGCAAMDVLVNEVGYEPNSPKTARGQRATDYGGDGTFSVRRVLDNVEVYSGTLVRKGGLWDKFYWAGDFSAFKTSGDYYVYATVNGENGTSFNFTIAPNVLLTKTGKLAYQYFTAQRCGTAVSLQYVDRTGTLVTWSHNSCHTDDGYLKPSGPRYETWGGWHDSGEYQKYGQGFGGNPVFDLLCLYDSNRSYFDAIDANSNGIADILDEALWGAQWLARMVQPNGHVISQITMRRGGPSWVKPENDTNINDASDDRWVDVGGEATPQETVVCASLIRMHRVLLSKGLPTENFAQKALDIWNHRVALALAEGGHNNLGSGAHQIWAGLDLYAVYGLQDCWNRALQTVNDMATGAINNPSQYDDMNYSAGPGYDFGVMPWFARNYPATQQATTARTAAQVLMAHYINEMASPQNGLYRLYENGQFQYFPANPSLGLNRTYGWIAWGAIEAYKTIGNPAYLQFALDQYDWILGSNYFRVCMLEAAGDYHVNKYHSRYDTFVPNGIEPGVVPNGYIRDAAGLPWMYFGTGAASVQTNESWLPNSSAYVMALAAMSVFSETTPPGLVTSFTASPSGGQISLAWHNPSDVDFASTTIRMSTTGYPSGPADGTLVIDKAGSPNSDDSYLHTGLSSNTTYYYSAFTRDNFSNYSTAAHVSAATLDTIPPGPIASFTAVPGSGQVSLSWTNPTAPDFTGAMVRYKTTGYPIGPTDGTLVVDKPNSPGSSDSYSHAGLTNETTCYYSAFAHDGVPNYDSAVTARATPSGSGTCLVESFPYANGNLNGNGGWSGTAAGEIALESGTARIIGGTDSKDAVFLTSCSGSGGIIDGWVQVRLGSGSNTMWGVWFDDPNGNNLARWYGSGITAKPRIGGTTTVLPEVNLTGGWDLLRVRMNTAANASEFFFNGTSLGTLSHAETGAGNSTGRVRIERIGNASSTPAEFINLDNLVIGPAPQDVIPPGPVTGFTATNQESQVSLSWTNPTDADYAGTKILYKTTGYPSGPSDGTVLHNATGTSFAHTNPPGGTIYYAAYAYDGMMSYSSAATASVTRAQGCFSEGFPYANGNLNGNGGWSGSATSQIAVENQTAKVSGGSGVADAVQTLSCGSLGNQVGVWAKIKKGTGTSIFWNLWIDDPSGNNFGYWFGTGTAARGRTGAQQTASKTLTGTSDWDYLYVKIDFSANTTQFFFNGVSIGNYSHAGNGAGDALGRIRFERTDSSGASGQYLYFDDLLVTVPDTAAPMPAIGPPSAAITRTCPVSYTVIFDQPVFGFSSASDIQVNATGSAAAGLVTVAGSGPGPYTVTLSNIAGSGTLGATVKASSCTDAAGNANSASAASATFRVLGSDGRISDVKDASNGTPVALGGKALYLRQTGFGYIEETDRTMGIRVEGFLAGSVDDLVSLSGVMATRSGGERYVIVDAMAACGTGSVDPLGLSNRALIDAMVCGLYVKAWGKVKPGSIIGNSYVLTDGSDDSGIKVITPSAPSVGENDFVTVVGAAGFDEVRVIY